MSALAIETAGLTRRFGDVLALDALGLVVGGPGVFGFLGANGAGKTTTMRLLLGLLKPDAGTIRLLGEPLEHGDGRARRLVGYLPQAPAFPPWMTAEEYLVHTGELFGLPRAEGRRRAGELLERCGLADAAKRRTGGFSGGMKQRLGIAQALVSRPALLLLDEPVSALDPIGRAQVLDLLEELGRDATVFLSSHILADVERVCEEVAILDHGRLVVQEKTASLKARAVRPVVTLVLRGGAGPLEGALRALPFVTSVAAADAESPGLQTLRVSVSDLAEAERALPRVVADRGAALVSLNPAVPSLEEIFMELVQKPAEARA